MTEERRGHARKRISASVTFHAGEGAPLHGWLRDISRGGCFIATQSRLPVGEVFELEFRLPGMLEPIRGKARVAWLREKSANDLPAGMGVALVDVPAERLDAIDRVGSPSVARTRARTMVGVAPPPAASSPSFSPEVPEEPTKVEQPLQDTAEGAVPVVEEVTDVVPMQELQEAQEPAPPPTPPPAPPPPPPPVASPPPFPPPPPVSLPPSKRRNARWIALGGVLLLLAAGVTGLVKAVRSCGTGADAGPALDVAIEAEPQAADALATDAEEEETPGVGTAAPAPGVDAGHDAGHDAGKDAGRDAGKDAGHHDAGKDAGHHDAGKDAGKGKRHGAH